MVNFLSFGNILYTENFYWQRKVSEYSVTSDLKKSMAFLGSWFNVQSIDRVIIGRSQTRNYD